MSGGMLLSEYNPVSMQCTQTHEVIKPKFPVFDSHTHIGALLMDDPPGEPVDIGAMVECLKESGVTGVIELKMFWGEPLKRHIESLEGYRDFIHTFATLDVKRLEESGFAGYVDETLKRYSELGIRGLKFWKNIGCVLKDSSGNYIRPDDDRLRPVWEVAAKYGLFILFHIADPKSFFTPIDKHNEFYEALCENPDWSFYDKGSEGRYTFEQLMQQQDNLLTTNPDTTFIIPHMGSCTEDLAWVGSQLDKHSNMYIDTSARINLLGRQPYTAREFFLKYSDRILFGTDYGFGVGGDETRGFYEDHYRFFETFDEYFRPVKSWGWGQGRWNIYGLGLPDDILKKLYYQNASDLFGFL
ncbi:MAG: amidohydrolase family protein [Oscillospiraceae bacterium]|nr:amidohydrolase family protein [Oscillospiraceae bacterium]